MFEVRSQKRNSNLNVSGSYNFGYGKESGHFWQKNSQTLFEVWVFLADFEGLKFNLYYNNDVLKVQSSENQSSAQHYKEGNLRYTYVHSKYKYVVYFFFLVSGLKNKSRWTFFRKADVPFFSFFVWEMALESWSIPYIRFVSQKWDVQQQQQYQVGLPFPTSAYLTCIIESSPRIANTILCFLLSDGTAIRCCVISKWYSPSGSSSQ